MHEGAIHTTIQYIHTYHIQQDHRNWPVTYVDTLCTAMMSAILHSVHEVLPKEYVIKCYSEMQVTWQRQQLVSTMTIPLPTACFKHIKHTPDSITMTALHHTLQCTQLDKLLHRRHTLVHYTCSTGVGRACQCRPTLTVLCCPLQDEDP